MGSQFFPAAVTAAAGPPSQSATSRRSLRCGLAGHPLTGRFTACPSLWALYGLHEEPLRSTGFRGDPFPGPNPPHPAGALGCPSPPTPHLLVSAGAPAPPHPRRVGDVPAYHSLGGGRWGVYAGRWGARWVVPGAHPSRTEQNFKPGAQASLASEPGAH